MNGRRVHAEGDRHIFRPEAGRKMSQSPRGHSLIELLVVIAASSSLLAVTVGLLHTLFQMQQGGRKHIQERRTVERLAEQFREDVHAATQLRPLAAGKGQAEGPGWELPREGDLGIEYRLHANQLLRTERQKDKVLRREAFALPPDTTATMGTADSTPGLVTLRIGRTIRVDAALALDRRFLGGKGGGR